MPLTMKLRVPEFSSFQGHSQTALLNALGYLCQKQSLLQAPSLAPPGGPYDLTLSSHPKVHNKCTKITIQMYLNHIMLLRRDLRPEKRREKTMQHNKNTHFNSDQCFRHQLETQYNNKEK